MPLWLIFHPPNTFTTPASRSALATSLTSVYTSAGLPPFYVVINFIPVPGDTHQFIGGQASTTYTSKPFIRLVGEHIAIRLPNEDAAYKSTTDRIDRALKPHIEDMGYDWEYHVDETERRLWKINGLVPPPFKGEEERRWREANRALRYEGDGKLEE